MEKFRTPREKRYTKPLVSATEKPLHVAETNFRELCKTGGADSERRMKNMRFRHRISIISDSAGVKHVVGERR